MKKIKLDLELIKFYEICLKICLEESNGIWDPTSFACLETEQIDETYLNCVGAWLND